MQRALALPTTELACVLSPSFFSPSHLRDSSRPFLASDTTAITKSFVNHVHTSLARQAYNLDNFGAYQASALSVRDNLLVRRICPVPFGYIS